MTTDQLADLLELGILILDAAGRVTLWNRWLEERSGRRREEVLGRVLWEVYPELKQRGLEARLRQVLEAGQPQVLSPVMHGSLLPLPGPDGEPMPQLARLLPLRENSRVVGAVITLQDMSDVDHLEKELLRATEQLRLLQETAGSLAAMRSLEERLQAIADRALEALEAQGVFILVHDEQAGGLRPVARATRIGIERLEEGLQQVVGKRFTEFVIPFSRVESALVRVATTGQPLIGVDILKLETTRRGRLVLRALRDVFKLEAITILPLRVAGRVVGVIAFDSPPREQITSHDQALYETFAGQAAVAIENARLFEELRQQYTALERRAEDRWAAELYVLFRLSQRLGRALNYDELFQPVLEAMSQLLSPDLCAAFFVIGDEVHLWLYHHWPLSPELKAAICQQTVRLFRTAGQREIPAEQVRVRFVPAPDYDPQAPPLEGQVRCTSAPLIMQNRAVGLLQVCALGERTITSQEVRLLHALAYQTVLALQRLRAVLERERSLLQAMVEGMADGVILLDERGALVAANALGRELHTRLCRCQEDGSGKDACPIHALARAALAQEAGSVDREIRADERFYVARAAPAAVPLATEATRGVVITLRDVTEQRVMQEQLFQASKLAAIGELAAGVAHEVNNPLSAIIGFSDLLLLDAKDEKTRDMLQKIRSQGMRARDIVQNLLNFARSQRLVQEVMDLNAVIKEAVALVRRQLELDNIQVIEEYDPDLPRIVGDAGQLQQVVLNMLQNAHDAIMMSGQGSRVVVRTRRLGKDWVAFDVEDDGPGIPEDIREHIFNPFFTTKPPGKGTGLGLSISHRIVKKHDGRITVRSRPGRGARFTVELPLRPAAERPELAEGSRSESDTGGKVDSPNGSAHHSDRR